MPQEDPIGSPKVAVVECVGSLLVPSSRLQELSEHHESPKSPDAKEREMIGSILLPPSDILPHREETHEHEEQKQEPFMVRLQKRITKELQKPPPEDSPDFWFY